MGGKEVNQANGSRLSKQVCLSTTPEDEIAGLHASLFNLVVYSPKPSRTPYFKSLVEDIVDYFPCRVLFVEACASSSEDCTGFAINFNSYAMRKGPYLTGYEEISLRCHSSQKEQIPFRLMPYFLPDLPIYLIWGQDPTTEYDILPTLLPVASRLIIDSEATDNLQRFTRQVQGQARGSNLDVIDLNWTRIKGWRDVIAEVFDTPSRVQQLSMAHKLVIKYNGRQDPFFSHNEIQAIYLQGWLAAQLHWQLRTLKRGAGNSQLNYHNGIQDMLVELIAEDVHERSPGSILSFEVWGEGDHHYAFKRLPGQQMATVQVSSTQTCQVPFNLVLWGSERRYHFLRELFYCDPTTHYLHTLHTLSQQGWK